MGKIELKHIMTVQITGYGTRTLGIFDTGEQAMAALSVFRERHKAVNLDSADISIGVPYLYICQPGKQYINGQMAQKKFKNIMIDTNRVPAAWTTATVEAVHSNPGAYDARNTEG